MRQYFVDKIWLKNGASEKRAFDEIQEHINKLHKVTLKLHNDLEEMKEKNRQLELQVKDLMRRSIRSNGLSSGL